MVYSIAYYNEKINDQHNAATFLLIFFPLGPMLSAKTLIAGKAGCGMFPSRPRLVHLKLFVFVLKSNEMR